MTEWNRILHEKQYSQEEPDKTIALFIRALRKRRPRLRVLDLACGAGRHTVYVAKQDLETHGADLSKTGLEQTKQRLKKQNLSGHLMKCDMKLLPYASSRFDAVICFQAIYHQKREAIRMTLTEIRRILGKNGLLLTSFLSKNTYSYGKGVKIERDTFAETEGPEKGVIHLFVDKESMVDLLGGFDVVRTELKERLVRGKHRSVWIVEASVQNLESGT